MIIPFHPRNTPCTNKIAKLPSPGCYAVTTRTRRPIWPAGRRTRPRMIPVRAYSSKPASPPSTGIYAPSRKPRPARPATCWTPFARFQPKRLQTLGLPRTLDKNLLPTTIGEIAHITPPPLGPPGRRSPAGPGHGTGARLSRYPYRAGLLGGIVEGFGSEDIGTQVDPGYLAVGQSFYLRRPIWWDTVAALPLGHGHGVESKPSRKLTCGTLPCCSAGTPSDSWRRMPI